MAHFDQIVDILHFEKNKYNKDIKQKSKNKTKQEAEAA